MQNESNKFKSYRVKNEYLTLILGIILVLLLNYIILKMRLCLLIFLILIEIIYVALINASQIGNSFHVTKESLPNVFKITEKISQILSINNPKLFIQQSPELNAFTIGITNPSIIITSGLYDILDDDELAFVIGHEIGHILFSHNIIKTLVFPAGNKIPVLNYIFNFWSRDTEYTADRIGLACSKNINSALSALTKLTTGAKVAKLIRFEFLEKQELEIKDKFRIFGETLSNHPYSVKRLNRLILFNTYINQNNV